MQFTIRDLLVFTTIFAILIALPAHFWREENLIPGPFFAIIFLCFLISLVITMFISLWIQDYEDYKKRRSDRE